MAGGPSPRELRVRFSPDIFRVQRHGGVSRYVVELHRGLLAGGADSAIIAGLHRSARLHGVPRVYGADIDGLQPAKLRQGLSRVVDRCVGWGYAANLRQPIIWHASYFPGDVPRRAPFAVTVYDMIHERFPEWVSSRDLTLRYKRRACEAADVIFAISQHSADDVCDRFSISPDRVVVTPLGVRAVTPLGHPRPFGDEPFLLYVGERRSPHKNWIGLLDALRMAGSASRLVCFGSPEQVEDRRALLDRGLDGSVAFVGGDDAALAGWYQAAAALIYPSFYEGFGLPPLEAMAQGCAVVATKVGAIPEVVGQSAMLVDPDPASLAEGICSVLANGPVIETMREKGPAHAAGFTWAETVRRTIEGYRRIVS